MSAPSCPASCLNPRPLPASIAHRTFRGRFQRFPGQHILRRGHQFGGGGGGLAVGGTVVAPGRDRMTDAPPTIIAAGDAVERGRREHPAKAAIGCTETGQNAGFAGAAGQIVVQRSRQPARRDQSVAGHMQRAAWPVPSHCDPQDQSRRDRRRPDPGPWRSGRRPQRHNIARQRRGERGQNGLGPRCPQRRRPATPAAPAPPPPAPQRRVGCDRLFDAFGRQWIQFAVGIDHRRRVVGSHAASPNRALSAWRPHDRLALVIGQGSRRRRHLPEFGAASSARAPSSPTSRPASSARNVSPARCRARVASIQVLRMIRYIQLFILVPGCH